MPAISMFYGIIVYMYFTDHSPKHIHVHYGEYKAQFDFNGKMIVGKIPNKKKKLVQAWIEIHKEDLEADWELSQKQDGSPLFNIDPLK